MKTSTRAPMLQLLILLLTAGASHSHAASADDALASGAAMAAPLTDAKPMHARAVELFRQGRFPEAYGRFIELANAGHPASARHALWMCEQGPTLFGSDWDCAPHEVEDWARAAGVALPRIATPQYVAPNVKTRPQPEKREIR